VVVAGLIVATVMLRGKTFGRATPWVGVSTNGLFLTSYISLAFVSTTSVLSTVLSISASILLFVWWILIARKLFQLGRGLAKEDGTKSELEARAKLRHLPI